MFLGRLLFRSLCKIGRAVFATFFFAMLPGIDPYSLSLLLRGVKSAIAGSNKIESVFQELQFVTGWEEKKKTGQVGEKLAKGGI